jgi:hypothetical protein
MKQLIRISRLDRVITVLDGSAQLENPYDVRNLRLQGYDSYIRYGYNTVRSAQATYTPKTAYGLGWFQGVSQVTGETKATPKEEFITIEQAGSPSAIRPYLRDATTLAPTQIGTSTLVAGYWNFANYNDYVYAINPKADNLVTPQPTVYKHLIGETVGDNAWLAVQDSAYVDAGSDVELSILADNPITRPFVASDSFTFPVANSGNDIGIWNAGSTFVVNANNGIDVSGNNNDNGQISNIPFTVTFAPTEDWSTFGDYASITITAGNVFSILSPSNKAPILRTNGVDRTLEYREFVNTSKNTLTIMFRLKGVASLNLVQKFTFTVSSNVNRYVNGLACKFEPIKFGGVYLEQTQSTQRIWDDTLVGNGIYYGVRYKNGTTYSTLIQKSITSAQSQGFLASSFSKPLGGKISLSVPQRTTGGWTDVEFVRQLDDASGWKIISTQPNSGGTIQFKDTYQENELSPLTTATGITTTILPTPAFRTAGIVGAFAYKQSMIWLINQTYQNLQFSRVGDPLELYDSTASLSYDPEDVTVPAQFTLADDQADVPVWGTQAGQIAFIIGETAAYAMVGDFPKSMSPSRQIPGSRGIAGYYAGTRFRSYQGIWGAAYADPELNIWLVNSVPRFVGDASVQPQELSLPVRGKLKDFLYTTQQPEYGTELKIEDVKVVFQESVSSLWVILGHRAAVYRQDMVGNGWELYDYSLASTGTINTCTTYFTNGAIAHDHNGGDTTWTNFGYPFASDNSYCTNAFGLPSSPSSTIARTTKHLRCHSYLPSPLIPAGATITDVRWKVEDSKVGDLSVTQNVAQPTLNGSNYGANKSTNRLVTDADAEQIYTLSSLPSVADINAGHLGIDLQYTQEVWNSNWNDPANYTVTISPTSPQVYTPSATPSLTTNYTVTVTYTGAGAKPPRAYVQFNGTTLVGGDVVTILKQGDTSINIDGNIDTDSGLIGTLPVVPPDLPDPKTISASLSIRLPVILTSGVGSKTVLMESSSDLSTAKFQATHTLTATFSPAVTSTVRVDNVAAQVCYNVTTTGTEIQWSRVVFSPNGKNVAFRSSGELDVIEYDYRNSSFISGTNRDGGIAPPDWYFVTQQIQWDGAKARLASVQYHGQNATDLIQTSLSVDDGAYVNGALAGVNTSRWYGWHPSISSGIRHKIKFTGSETDSSLKGFALEFNTQSKGKPK